MNQFNQQILGFVNNGNSVPLVGQALSDPNSTA
jgi:hypothetical protein